jgi:effector-binding domain-containing protein
VEHRTVAQTAAVGIHDVVDREDILAWWQGAVGELHATVHAQGVRPTGAIGGLYASEIFEHDRGQATVFIPVDGPVRAIGRVAPLIVPGAELAVIRHHGSIANIDLTYEELGAYVITHEIGVQGPLRENYVRGFLDTEDPRRGNQRSDGRSSAPIPTRPNLIQDERKPRPAEGRLARFEGRAAFPDCLRDPNG